MQPFPTTQIQNVKQLT